MNRGSERESERWIDAKCKNWRQSFHSPQSFLTRLFIRGTSDSSTPDYCIGSVCKRVALHSSISNPRENMAFVGYEIVSLMETECKLLMSVRTVCSAALEFDLKRQNKFATYCLEQPSYQVSKCRLDSQLPGFGTEPVVVSCRPADNWKLRLTDSMFRVIKRKRLCIRFQP